MASACEGEIGKAVTIAEQTVGEKPPVNTLLEQAELDMLLPPSVKGNAAMNSRIDEFNKCSEERHDVNPALPLVKLGHFD